MSPLHIIHEKSLRSDQKEKNNGNNNEVGTYIYIYKHNCSSLLQYILKLGQARRRGK